MARVSLLLLGVLLGANMLSPVSAHLTTFNHVKKKHFYTKKVADKRFVNERDIAWAHVETIQSVSFIKKHNFVSVDGVQTGIYCLTPKAGIDPAERIAIVSPENDHSAGGDLEPQWLADAGGCAAGQFEVLTLQGGVADDEVSFAIYVP